MGNVVTDPQQFSKVFENVLGEYRQQVFKGVVTETQKSMKSLVKRTKNDAPKKKLAYRAAGTYAKHITSKPMHQTSSSYAELWFVKSPEYRLTHLLNDGHALRQGGRAAGTKFLSNAVNDELKAYELALRQVVERDTR